MAEGKSRLEGKRIFIVDDEPDILKTLGELFSMGDVTKGSNFEGARALFEKKHKVYKFTPNLYPTAIINN